MKEKGAIPSGGIYRYDYRRGFIFLVKLEAVNQKMRGKE